MKKWIVVLMLFFLVLPIVVIAAPPKVKLVATPISGVSPLTVSVSENSGDKRITSWRYDFGDGTVETTSTATHIYGVGGKYSLTLTVSNSAEETSSESITITVTDAQSYTDINTTYQVTIEGSSVITDLLVGKTETEKSTILTNETKKALKPVKFPFTYKTKNSEIAFDNYCCDISNGLCGYWIQAWRIDIFGRHTVQTDSPIWISPPPYDVVVSEQYFPTTNSITVVVKEDLLGAITSVIQNYADRHPIGEPVTRTFECNSV